jgi:hypothetical protein
MCSIGLLSGMSGPLGGVVLIGRRTCRNPVRSGQIEAAIR